MQQLLVEYAQLAFLGGIFLRLTIMGERIKFHDRRITKLEEVVL